MTPRTTCGIRGIYQDTPPPKDGTKVLFLACSFGVEKDSGGDGPANRAIASRVEAAINSFQQAGYEVNLASQWEVMDNLAPGASHSVQGVLCTVGTTPYEKDDLVDSSRIRRVLFSVNRPEITELRNALAGAGFINLTQPDDDLIAALNTLIQDPAFYQRFIPTGLSLTPLVRTGGLGFEERTLPANPRQPPVTQNHALRLGRLIIAEVLGPGPIQPLRYLSTKDVILAAFARLGPAVSEICRVLLFGHDGHLPRICRTFESVAKQDGRDRLLEVAEAVPCCDLWNINDAQSWVRSLFAWCAYSFAFQEMRAADPH